MMQAARKTITGDTPALPPSRDTRSALIATHENLEQARMRLKALQVMIPVAIRDLGECNDDEIEYGLNRLLYDVCERLGQHSNELQTVINLEGLEQISRSEGKRAPNG